MESNTPSKIKLTEWVNEPTVNALKADFLACKPSHDVQVGRIEYWKDLLDVTGPEKIQTAKGRSRVQPKLDRKQAE